jgi:transcriptional regulator with PAS, ATPase and Fis domain
VPGVVVVFTAGAPSARAISLATGPVELGRGEVGSGKIEDGRVSRRHVRVAFEAGRCVATDLGSQNGSFVDGQPIAAGVTATVDRVIRIGDSLVVPCGDVRPFRRATVCSVDGLVRGPTMLAVLEEAAGAARSGTTLHVRGESGSGKEGVVQAFHRALGDPSRPLVAVNCAAIPPAIAERLLFGARRGAYSGAEADAPGYLQAADGGTLFLDEIAELDLQVQAKLLRALESREVLPLGASRPRKLELAFCSATHRDLRTLVATGAVREDLYFRVGRPEVTLPPLRARPEEIPALIARELARLPAAPIAHVSLVEQCLLRPWPGNVRELLAEIRVAAQAAASDGNRVTAHHLAASAGTVFGDAAASRPAATGTPAPPPDPPAATPKRTPPSDVELARRIEDALRAHGGKVAAAARALGMHRTQLRRLIKRHAIAVPEAPGDE